MSWQNLSEPTKNSLVQVYRLNKSLAAITPYAEQLGMNPSTLMRNLQRYNREQEIEFQAEDIGIRLPDQSTRKWNDYLVLESEDALIISDLESPDTDLVWIETVILVAIRHKIKRLVILGDLSAGDQEGLATHLAVWRESGEIDYSTHIGMLRKMIDILKLWFVDGITVISGNHDERISKVTGGQAHLGMFLGDQVQFSRYRKMYIRNHRGYIACYHQSNFSDNGIKVGRGMYEQENFEGAHPYAVIVTHIHHWACGKSKDNLCEIYSLGCSRSRELTQYVNVTPSSHAQWSQSMILMKQGYMRNLERSSTNWQEELGEFAHKASICSQIS